MKPRREVALDLYVARRRLSIAVDDIDDGCKGVGASYFMTVAALRLAVCVAVTQERGKRETPIASPGESRCKLALQRLEIRK